VSKFRILSIFLAVGLLVGALGVGPVLAGQIDVTGLDTRDASYAPYALDVDAGEVEWATGTDDDVAAAEYANDDQMAVFYVNDDDLEGTSDEQIATWTSTVPATNGVTQGFNVLDGEVAGVVHTNFSIKTGPMGEDVPATTTTFVGNAGNTPIHSVTMIIAKAGNAATSTLTRQALESPEENLVKVLGGTIVFDFVEIRFKHHVVDSPDRRARVVSDSDPQGEYVTISEVGAVGSTDPNASSNIYRGEIRLSDDPANRGPGEELGAVWVQDGDSLTVHYLDDEGDIVDSDSITVDAMAPEISGFEPADGTNTSVTNPTLQFDATDEGSGFDSDSAMDHFTVTIGTQLDEDGKNPSGGTEIDTSDYARIPVADGYRVVFTTSDSWIATYGDDLQDDKLNVTVTATDIADNESVVTNSIVIDTGSPTVLSAETGIGWDSADDEETDASNGVKVVMSETIDPDSVQAADFEIDNVAAVDAVVGTGEDFTANVYVTAASDLDPDATPRVEVVGEVTDLSGNELDITKDTSEARASDSLSPTVTVSRDVALLAAEDDEVVVTIASDEKLRADGAVVSIFGPSEAGHIGGQAKADAPLVRSFKHAISKNAETGAYGIAVKITDLGSNPSNNLKSGSDEELAIEDNTITVSNGPIADDNFDDTLDGMDVSVVVMDENGNVVATSTQVTVMAVDASKRTIKIAAVTDGATANVTYKYPSADNTFEVDQSGPGVSFSLADDAKLTNSSPFIEVSFNDDEYPGDSYTDVSLTAATLTMGEDETDISGDFAVEGNGHDYLWAGVSLALGEYTLAVTGEDTAGNSTDGELTFTIIERSATQIALNPGVNLISLPGTPATSSIEGVFGGSDVTSVLTYDPSTPTKWLAAEQAPDGSWVGNLTEVSASLGYWVTTTSFDALSVDIVSFSAGGATLPPTHNLVPGWNLVAVTTLDEVVKTGDATPVDANTYLGNNWLRAITYDAKAGRFQTQGPDDLDDDGNPPTLQVGKGYFVWMTKPHTVVP
jgi:hypothetical protein